MAEKTAKPVEAGINLSPVPSIMGKEENGGGSITAGENSSTDESELFLQQHGFTTEYLNELVSDKEKNKRLVKKVDMLLLPLMAGTYVLQFIDKQALSYSAVFDLLESTGTTLEQYSWFGSIFYFAYLVAEYPWSFLAQKTLMGKVVAGCILAWGSILMITAASSNFAGLAVCRFFLGTFEAPITPIFMMIVGMWYTREEQPFRAGVFYSCNGIGLMLGGLLSFAIGQIQGFEVWKAIFIICGGITVLFGGIMLWKLPDNILRAKGFSLEEKALLIGRARLAKTGVLNRTIKWSQVWECLMDPQVWLLFIFVLVNEVINGGIGNFGSLIIKGLVDNALLSVVLGIPQGAFQVFWILSGTWLASRYQNMRTVIMAVYNIPTILGLCLIWKLDRETQKVGLLFGYYMVTAYVTSLVLALQMPSSNLGGYTKRVTGTAVVFAAYCAGNIIGPHAFLAREAPVYQTGVIVMLACGVAQVVLAGMLRYLLILRNKKRDQAAAESIQAPEDTSADVTDFNNPHFRYVL
ncbi:major facilitator superfamily transporter [Fusarium mexicanum]|uniref:Major facilitator superfamily transporter n=1 Tax=Fusarium mexicanum TaxID=751941 RepID=A0A8H5J4W8_9HYPO|nr:major facilitator superfamily transporter [Fusarium mexicanum]